MSYNNPDNDLQVANSSGEIINPATEEKQDANIVALAAILTELVKKANTTDLEQPLMSMKLSLEQPPWYDQTRNGLNAVLLSGSTTAVTGTITTVTTVANVTQINGIGGFPADFFTLNTSDNAWANSLRNIYA